MIGFPLCPSLLPLILLHYEVVLPVQVLLILRRPLRYVSGEHAEICIDHERQGYDIKKMERTKHGHDQQYQGYHHQKPGKLVGTIAPGHKLLKFLLHNNLNSFHFAQVMVS